MVTRLDANGSPPDTGDMLLSAILLATSIAGPMPPTLPAFASGEASLELARQLLPDARPHRTSRYVVLSDSERSHIRGAELVLEETRRQYDRWCRAMRIPITRPDERLLCILFHNRDDFVTFAEQTEDLSGAAHHISGYFSPRFDWVVYFDPDDSADIGEAVRSIEAAEADIEEARERGVDQDRLDEATESVDAAREHIQSEARARRTAVTIHEAVHQLVHNGLAFPGRGNWPAWLHEGLAVAFETDAHRKPFGPDRDYPSRSNGFATALKTSTHIPLPQFLELNEIHHQDGAHVGVIYDQAGSLVSWLYRRRRPQLLEFLQEAGIPDADGTVPPIATQFTKIFGSTKDIERYWHADSLRD